MMEEKSMGFVALSFSIFWEGDQRAFLVVDEEGKKESYEYENENFREERLCYDPIRLSVYACACLWSYCQERF